MSVVRILVLNPFDTVWRPVYGGKYEYVHFFIYGGILALPYQFYHHAHKMLCDHDQIFSFFLFDTLRHGVYSLLTIQTILAVYNPGHAVPPQHAVPYTQINP